MKDTWKPTAQRWVALGKKYRYVLLVLLVGVLLLRIPTGSSTRADSTAETEENQVQSEEDTLSELENRLAQALGRIDGVGETTVVLTLASGSRQVYATDTETEVDGESSSTTESIAVISTGSGTQAAVEVVQMSPTFQGALVVCQGGANASVRLAVTESVSALTGLSTDKISVCAGN